MKSEDAVSLLRALVNTGVPPQLKEYYLHYTAGDEFRELALKFKTEIVDLAKDHHGYSPRIILGDIGIGKTHFLRYLYLKLGQDIPDLENTLCSWIDLRDLEENTDFQYLLMRGLRNFTDDISDGAHQYQKVLQVVYRRLADPIIQNRKVTEDQRRVIVRKVLDDFWEFTAAVNPIAIPLKWFAGITLRGLQIVQERRYKEEFQKRVISEEMNSFSNLAYEKDFIHEFIKLGEGKFPNPDFDLFVEKLAKQSRYDQLTDLVMRLLNKAGYKSLVIFIDEMEHIKASGAEKEKLMSDYSQRTADILNLFFKLHTKMSIHAGQKQNNSYPSVAQIMVMPDELYDDVVRKNDPALYDRWELVKFPLDIIPKTSHTADELITNMWRLHQEAGYSLKMNSDKSMMECIKSVLYNQLNRDSIPATMRHLIPRLIKIIQTEWMIR